MPRKGSMLCLFKGDSHPHQGGYNPVSHHTLSAKLMAENISVAESLISKWELSSNSSVNHSPSPSPSPFLFHGTRDEARQFLQAVQGLQRAMVFFSSDECLESPKTRSESLVRAQNLMQAAMNRLEKEFHRILSASSVSHPSPRSILSDLDPSWDDETRTAGDSIAHVENASTVATADLRSIAETMMAAGYGMECVKIYKIIRKSTLDEGLYRLGSDMLPSTQILKLDWEVLELKIRLWLAGAAVAVKTLFAGERVLCDHVFEGSDSIRESCFAEVTKEAATAFLAFPELVAKTKKSPEKLFRILDMHSALSDLWVEIESVFSFQSTASVRDQARSSLLKLGEAARLTIAEFESAIHKEPSKAAVPGGGIHPLTRYVMNYLVFLADYDHSLTEIYTDFQVQTPSPLPEFFCDSSSVSTSPARSPFESSPASTRIAWLILTLLCKLDGKADMYREVAQSYLFLMNNLQYIVKKVRGSGLNHILGEDWVISHDAKVRHYAASYERLGWARIAAEIPVAQPPESAAEKIRGFYAAFEEAVRTQREWVVADEKMRAELKKSVAEMIMTAYRLFYEAYRPIFSGDVAVVRYAPEDARARVMEIFSGSGLGSGSDCSSSSSSDSTSGRKGWWSLGYTH